MPDLDAVSDDLYGLDPSDFVAARTRYAAQAREQGDRELTAAIGRLRKPTVSAWMVNLLARERGDELAALLDIGAALRSAQRRLSGRELRTLSAQRRQVVAALERDAGRLAAERGRNVSDTALREVGRTLNAALADPEVGERVRRGRLEAIVDADAFDLAAVPLVAVPDPDRRAAEPEPADEPEQRKDERTDKARAEAEEAARRAALAEARDAANRALDTARAEAEDAERELNGCDEEVAEARRRLEHAEQKRTFARRAVAEARTRLEAAENAMSSVERSAIGLHE